jgi:hypothetical protein
MVPRRMVGGISKVARRMVGGLSKDGRWFLEG